ncbi:MAG: hypothetical protein APR53_09160 [Methanoculleus sp. SDB]|nr:MAG: hypothetical protein APR53_09160 [Methanoculleus sp. SDB]
MNLPTLVTIAVSLAMDAFAVSISGGITMRGSRWKNALTLALFFGAFQAIMPVIGWAFGEAVSSYMEGIDHWIAFLLLALIGVHMIREGRKDEEQKNLNSATLWMILLLSVATSIDALAVGLTFAFLNVPILTAALLIGVITALISYGGFFIGDRWGHHVGEYAETGGGLILIGIGLKILFDHLGILPF